MMTGRLVKPDRPEQSAAPQCFTPEQWAAIERRIAEETAARRRLVAKLFQALKLFVDWADEEKRI